MKSDRCFYAVDTLCSLCPHAEDITAGLLSQQLQMLHKYHSHGWKEVVLSSLSSKFITGGVRHFRIYYLEV